MERVLSCWVRDLSKCWTARVIPRPFSDSHPHIPIRSHKVHGLRPDSICEKPGHRPFNRIGLLLMTTPQTLIPTPQQETNGRRFFAGALSGFRF